MGSLRIKKLQRRTSAQKCQSSLRDEEGKMNNVSPTILRTRHKFGDYLSQPDIAKFELPKKMSRPWIVNNVYEQEKLKELIVTEAPVEASEVMMQIKQSKTERKKHVGHNKKHVSNINEIIEKDHKTAKEHRKKMSKEDEEKKKKQVCKRREWRVSNAHDAIPAPTEVVVADHVPGKEDDQKETETKRDIEMEQQQMMNRVFNCPDLYTAAEPFTTMVQMMPVMVANQNGGFFVVQLPVQPLPQNIFLPQTSSSSCSSTCSSVSPPASDDGFVDGSDESADEMESLPEMDKLDLSQDLSMEEESDNDVDYEILDEDLERVVRSIIDEDD